MDNDELAAKMQKTYAKRGGKNGAIPWGEIIAKLLPLLLGCLPFLAKKHAKRHPEATKERIDMRLAQERPDLSKRDRTDVMEAAYAVLVAAKVDEIQSAQEWAS